MRRWKRNSVLEGKVNKRLTGMLGFAMRAGKVVIGTESVCSAMAKRGKDKPRLIIIAQGVSDGTNKKLLTKAEFYGIDTLTIDIDSGELGRLLGKLYAPATVAVVDDRFAEEIKRAVCGDDKDTVS